MDRDWAATTHVHKSRTEKCNLRKTSLGALDSFFFFFFQCIDTHMSREKLSRTGQCNSIMSMRKKGQHQDSSRIKSLQTDFIHFSTISFFFLFVLSYSGCYFLFDFF